MKPRSIGAINMLAPEEKERIYQQFIPWILMKRFGIPADFTDDQGRSLLTLSHDAGAADIVLDLRHEYGAEDPILYAHLTDTVSGQVHVLLYVVNDPEAPRFDVDRMPDGSPTQFGVFQRNIQAEIEAKAAGLAPGQVRRGLRILKYSVSAFEAFVRSLDHDMYFIEPLAYHNAIVFERYGFSYLKGRKMMERIDEGFQAGNDLAQALDGTSPFRLPDMAGTIRGRSWAIHDGILGHPFREVTMYKRVGEMATVRTFAGGAW